MDVQEKALDIIEKAVEKRSAEATLAIMAGVTDKGMATALVVVKQGVTDAVAEGYDERELWQMIYDLTTSACKAFESLPSYMG